MSRHMIERTTVRLPQELLKRAKKKAAAEGRTLTALIEDGLRWVVSSSEKPKKAARVLPRISAASGGPLPGFEENVHASAQDMEDREYVERLNRGFK
jgi:predicted DNA-binding protein